MSHLSCPLCGCNCPITAFNPEDQVNDIRVGTPMGRGYKKGFDPPELYSILGDKDITPKIIDRVYDLFTFFVKEGFIQKLDLINDLKLYEFYDQLYKRKEDYNRLNNMYKNELQKYIF